MQHPLAVEEEEVPQPEGAVEGQRVDEGAEEPVGGTYLVLVIVP